MLEDVDVVNVLKNTSQTLRSALQKGVLQHASNDINDKKDN